MRIFNIMVGRDLGGLQQAFIDYDVALRMQGHRVINISSAFAKINRHVYRSIKLPVLTITCFLSKIYLRILIAWYKPDIIIAHCLNSMNFVKSVSSGKVPLVGVAHNYVYKTLKQCDYVIAVTECLQEYMLEKGYDNKRILQVPNMLQIKREYRISSLNDPVIIGAMGRFVEHKGFANLIQAVALLKERGKKIKLLLAGDGDEEKSLKLLTKKLHLEDTVSFLGWISDKDKFFQAIDIFCLPSTHEPFGLVLLEAMEYSKPIVSARCLGPHEILLHKQDALLAERGSIEDLAENLVYFMDHPDEAVKCAKAGHKKLCTNYDINLVSKRLSNSLNQIK